jgi:hypothetical protein
MRVGIMKWLIAWALFTMVVGFSAALQAAARNDSPPTLQSLLDLRITRFDIDDGILLDGIAELSSEPVEELHLGFEEIIRGNINDDRRTLTPHFSLHLRDNTVGEILDALCASDTRYTWSTDGFSINIYPAGKGPGYLPNLELGRISLMKVPDPDQALTPLSRLLPNEQIGYFSPGLGDNQYSQPWTIAFEQVTVRQFTNRLAEHMGRRTSWVWAGGSDERMFTFVKGAFHAVPSK